MSEVEHWIEHAYDGLNEFCVVHVHRCDLCGAISYGGPAYRDDSEKDEKSTSSSLDQFLEECGRTCDEYRRIRACADVLCS